MRRSTTTFLTTNPATGEQTPSFPGGVILPTISGGGGLDAPANSVQWIDQNGAQVAIVSSNGTVVHMRGARPSSPTNTYAEFIVGSDTATPFVNVATNKPGVGQLAENLLSADGTSDYVRILDVQSGVSDWLTANPNSIVTTPPTLQFMARAPTTYIETEWVGRPGGQATTGTVACGFNWSIDNFITTSNFVPTMGLAMNFADTGFLLCGGVNSIATTPGQNYWVRPYMQIFNQAITFSARGVFKARAYHW